MRNFINDESGFIVSGELVLVLTIGVLGMVVGLASVRDSLTGEFSDLSAALGALDQTYNFRSISKGATATSKGHGQVRGAGYADTDDDCDSTCLGKLIFTDVCGKPDSSAGGSPNEGNL